MVFMVLRGKILLCKCKWAEIRWGIFNRYAGYGTKENETRVVGLYEVKVYIAHVDWWIEEVKRYGIM